MPPKASVEVESFINEIQHKFDKWKPPRWIKDNLTKVERKLLKSIQSDDQIVYMKEQYISAGEAELQKVQFYQEVNSDPSIDIKTRQDNLISRMFQMGEITEKVSDYLQLGGDKLSKFYHLLKTHNIPTNLDNPRLVGGAGFSNQGDYFWQGWPNRTPGWVY
jgi:hypothetical protein